MNRTLVVVLLALAAVAAWLFAVEMPRDRRELARAQRERRFFDFSVDQVDTVRWNRAPRPMVIARSDSGWTILEPVIEPADPDPVRVQLEELAVTERARVVADSLSDDEWSAFELAGPENGRVVLEVVLRGGRRQSIEVGAMNPNGTLCYVRRPGTSRLELADHQLHRTAQLDHHGFRRHDLFVVEAERIRALEVEGDHGPWRAVRDERGLWWGGGGPTRLDRSELDALAFAFATTRVRGYLRDGIREDQWFAYGLDRPWARVRYETVDGSTGAVELGNEENEGHFYARRPGEDTVFSLPPTFQHWLEIDPAELVNVSPLPVNVDRATRIVVRDGDGRAVEMRRETENGSWRVFVGTRGIEVDTYVQETCRNVVFALERLRPEGEMFLASSRTIEDSFERVAAEFEVETAAGTCSGVLVFGPGGTEHWLQVDAAHRLDRVDRGFYLTLRSLLDLSDR